MFGLSHCFVASMLSKLQKTALSAGAAILAIASSVPLFESKAAALTVVSCSEVFPGLYNVKFGDIPGGTSKVDVDSTDQDAQRGTGWVAKNVPAGGFNARALSRNGTLKEALSASCPL